MNDLKDLLGARLFLLDMDGTLYLGDDVFPGAVDFIHTLAETGRQYIYLTNNSSRAGTDYITRLRRLGFPCEAENVFTSGMATALYLNQHYAGKPVYLVGTQAFRRELLSYGIPLVEEGAEIVVAGFDTELVYEKLDKAVHFLRRGAAFIAANPDWVCPMPAGEVLPDCGSICALLTAASGVKPTYIGKPNRNMVDVISAQTGVPNAQICCVGDRAVHRHCRGRERGRAERARHVRRDGRGDPQSVRRAAEVRPARRGRAGADLARRHGSVRKKFKKLLKTA